jgi:mRNA interferase RelE/StbE
VAVAQPPVSYRIVILKSALKSLHGFDAPTQRRISERIDVLMVQPRGVDAIKLEGPGAGYRIRVGVYRVVYDIDDATRTVTVRVIDHRRQVYR